MNVVFQSIDLGCKTMAPIFVGLLMNYAGPGITAIVLALWNIVSAVLEYILLSAIFKEYPALLRPKKMVIREDVSHGGLLGKIRSSWHGWKLYMTHSTRNAGLSLASLYMTVLAFGNVLWAYSLLQCVSESLLSVLVGIAAINGIFGSVAF